MKNHIKDELLTTSPNNEKKNNHGEDERREHKQRRQRVCGTRRSKNECDKRARRATRASV